MNYGRLPEGEKVKKIKTIVKNFSYVSVDVRLISTQQEELPFQAQLLSGDTPLGNDAFLQ